MKYRIVSVEISPGYIRHKVQTSYLGIFWRTNKRCAEGGYTEFPIFVTAWFDDFDEAVKVAQSMARPVFKSRVVKVTEVPIPK